MERNEMFFPDPPRNPRRVRAGVTDFTVAAPSLGPAGKRVERRPIHILTTKVMSHGLAQELRSRAHTLITIEEAPES